MTRFLENKQYFVEQYIIAFPFCITVKRMEDCKTIYYFKETYLYPPP